MALDINAEETVNQLAQDIQLNQSIKKTYTTSQLGSNSDIQNLVIETMKPNFMMRNNCFIRKGVPESHRKVADSYMIIKKSLGSLLCSQKLVLKKKIFLKNMILISLN